VSSPTIAGGVVYYGDGAASHVRAIDAATGLPLWNSGSEIVDAIYGAPSVANGKLYVVAWDGKLRCFAPA
jgi:outer membrane protein assembly factor BamB